MLPRTLVRIENNSNGFSLIDVNQSATLPDSLEGGRLRVIGNSCKLCRNVAQFPPLIKSLKKCSISLFASYSDKWLTYFHIIVWYTKHCAH